MQVACLNESNWISEELVVETAVTARLLEKMMDG